jgi:phage anti-repressor protein
MTNVIKFNKEVQVEETPKAIKELFTLEKDTEGKPVISGRELYEALGIETPYKQWVDRMIAYGFEEHKDYVQTSEKVHTQKSVRAYKQTNHILTLDTAKQIAMIQRTPIGKMIREYFLSIEKDYLDYITGRKAFTEDNVQDSLENVIEIQEGIVAHFAVGKNTWRKDTDRVMKRLGTMNKRNYSEIRNIAYEKLEDELGVSLDTRLKNMKERLLKNGLAPSTVKAKNKMDVIALDDKLIQTYIKVVTELASEYKVEVSA